MTASGEGCCGQETARPPGRLFGGSPDRGAVRSAHLSAHLWRPLNAAHEDHQYVRSPWRIGSVPWMPGNTHAALIRCRQARDCRLGHAIAGPNLNNRTAPATRWDRAAAVMGRRWATLARCSQALFLRRTTIRRRSPPRSRRRPNAARAAARSASTTCTPKPWTNTARRWPHGSSAIPGWIPARSSRQRQRRRAASEPASAAPADPGRSSRIARACRVSARRSAGSR